MMAGMISPSYRTLAAGPDVTAEVEVKRSRFLAVLRRVGDEDAARRLTAELRRAHHDARHHCTAFVIGPGRQVLRSNDDGEPAGTAGMPMLEVLRNFGNPAGNTADGTAGNDHPTTPLSDVAAVVVRWFGGTLLGAGGLVRAYSDAVGQALASATFVRREERILATAALPHADAGRVEAELRAAGVAVLGTEYGASAVVTFATADPDDLRTRLAVATGGSGTLEVVGKKWIDLPDPAA